MKPNRFVPTIIFLIIIAAGCATSGKSTLEGIITQIELGKDGVQVVLQTEDYLYNVTISQMQTEVNGSFDQLVVGAEIEVSGEEIAGLAPPLIVADTVRVLGSPHLLIGSAWILTTYNGQQPINGYQPTMKFEADRISGSTGCNHFGGDFLIKDDTVKFEGVHSTEMACMEPEGIMDQERIYLETLQAVVRFSFTDEELVLFTDGDRYLKFSSYDALTTSTFSGDVNETVSVEAPTEVPENHVPTNNAPPWEYNQYQDAETRIGIFIPEAWIVTGIVEGEYAILQSYPEDKYVGGELFEEGDTKCDLAIHARDTQPEDLVRQWETDGFTSIISEKDMVLNTGYAAKRYELDSMGLSTVMIAELDGGVVVLTCFGNRDLFDEIAVTLYEIE